jgi:hypothetical protein
MRRGGVYACVACDLDFDSCSERRGEEPSFCLGEERTQLYVEDRFIGIWSLYWNSRDAMFIVGSLHV